MSDLKPVEEIYEWINQTTNVTILTNSDYGNISTANYSFDGKGPIAELIIRTNQHNYAIICVNNSSSDTVHDGAKRLANCWQNYNTSTVEYAHGGYNIDIDTFLLATQDSKNGHLFKKDRETTVEREPNDVKVTAGGEPLLSFTRSTTIFRVLYRYIDVFFDEVSPGVGILVSSELERNPSNSTRLPNTTPNPWAHYYRTKDGINFKEIK